MTAIFTDWFRAYLFGHQTMMASAPVAAVYFTSAPAFTDSNDVRYTVVQTVADLTGKLGWSAPSAPQTITRTVSTTTASGTVYVVANQPFTNGSGWTKSRVAAVALVYQGTLSGVVNPIIFLTSTPFPTVIEQDDALVALPNTQVGSNNVLFSWPIPPGGAPTVLPVEGGLTILAAPPDYELSHLQHAWIYPQRVNLLANPSFEGGTNHWRTNGTLTLLNEAAPGSVPSHAWSGVFTGSGTVVAESNTFPLASLAAAVGDHWTIQLMVKGVGNLKVGLVAWESDYASTGADWGGETWALSPTAWTQVVALRTSGDATTGMVRLECDGGSLTVDNVLCEPDWLKDWPYFDGDSTYGARDDFSWYGGTNRKGATYSLWYNHRNAVIGRLFAWSIPDDDFVVTDEEVEAQGFVYKWVPAGVRVTPHLDVLYQDDIQAAIPAVSGSVIPYNNNLGNAGVSNPWAATQYLTPTVGTVTTPDTSNLLINADTTWIARVRLGDLTNTANFVIACQRPQGATNLAWQILRQNGAAVTLRVSINGTAFTQTGTIPGGSLATAHSGDTVTLAFSVDMDNGASGHTITYWMLVGTTWTQIGTATVAGALTALFDSTVTLTVGGYTNATGSWWDDLVYSMEQRTGLDPAAGLITWRFDATEYPGSGTSYTDPRGRVWTLTSAAAIAH